ncbi:MAG: NAD(P)H-dependent oxidoreductase [Arenicella sp.]
MNALILYCHPEPKSFNAALKEIAIHTLESLGYSVEVSDLYAERFDPVEKAEHYPARINDTEFKPLSEQRNAYQNNTLATDVQREIQRLKRCDLLVLQFPLWWHQQPAMLKGWFDRVFIGGGLYTSKMRYDTGFFKGKHAICCVTSGAPINTFSPLGRGGGKIEDLLLPLNFSLHYMGFTVLPPHLIGEVQNPGFSYKNDEQLAKDLELSKHNWKHCLANIDHTIPLSFPGWSDWDENGVEKVDH